MNAQATAPILPLQKSITVPWSPDAAFRHFTTGIASWWPLRTHSVGQEKAETVVFEDRVGGRIYERMRGGEESTWGTVTCWEPPRRVAFTWHPGSAIATCQEVEVRFVPEGRGTRLELTHTGWERLGEVGSRVRRGYGIGWEYVLRFWAGRKGSLVVRGIDALSWVMRPLQERLARKMAASTEAAARSSS